MPPAIDPALRQEIDQQIAVLEDISSRNRAYNRLVEIGDAAIDPLLEAQRNGTLKEPKYGILSRLGPRGLDLTLEAARSRRKDAGPAISALGSLVPPPLAAVEIAIAGLRSRRKGFRSSCVGALSELAYGVEVGYGRAACARFEAAVPDLLRCLEEDHTPTHLKVNWKKLWIRVPGRKCAVPMWKERFAFRAGAPSEIAAGALLGRLFSRGPVTMHGTMQKPIPPFEVLHTIRNLEDIRTAERAQPRDALPWKSTWDVFRAAAEHFGERPALTFLPTGELGEEPRRFTHRELFTHITQAANLLHRVGVGPRDAVGILAPHLPETHFALWGAEAAGIACPINPLLRVEQIVGLLRAAGARHLVALGPDESMPIWRKVEILLDHLPELEILRIDPNPTSGDDFLTRLLDEPGDALTSGREIATDEVAAYFHTGGTTGTPKLASHTHGNQIWAAWGGVQLYDLGPEDVQSNGLPLFHVAGTIIGFLAPIGAGAEVVALSPAGMRNPHIIRNHWRLMQAHGVTICGGVPTALAKLLEIPVADADLSKIDTIVTGASPMPLDVARRVEKQVGAPVREVFGMTEAGGLISLTPRRGERHLGAVGLPLPHQEVRIVRLGADGDLGEACAPEESGMLLLRGPNITPGYRNPEHDVGAFTEEGWFMTGDLATRGEDGWLRVTGRAKDLIIRGGHNIDPVLIEEAVESHPNVALAAAVGQPDDYAGEVPVLYVTLRPGAKSTEDELAAFVAERIAEPPARPRWIEILAEMPMTEVGKIFKPELRKRAASRAEAVADDS